MRIHKRFLADTPPFFRKLRVVGLVLAGIGSAVLAVPEVMGCLAVVAEYLVVAGSAISAVSQVAVEEEK